MKKLTRSNNKMISGVCAGIAEYFDIDPTIVRLLWILVTIFTVGVGIIGYIAAVLIMPKAEEY